MSRNWKKRQNFCLGCEKWRERQEDEVCKECPFMMDASADFFGEDTQPAVTEGGENGRITVVS